MYKNIIITGASQGIGKALAFEYADHSANLILLSRNESAIESIADDITSLGGNAYYKKCDVSDIKQVKDAIEYSINVFGTIDLAVLNAGTGNPEWMGQFKSGDLKKVFETNVFGIAHFLEFLIPIMKEQGYGTIAGVSSLADSRGYGGSSSYSASKSAVTSFLESSRVELKKYNIDVITVKPGFVRTSMTAKNEFYMPFLMEPAKAARIIRKGIERKRSIVQFPFGTVMLSRLIKYLPNWIYDPAMRLGRKGPKK
jgi:short-subunit dehydrogenase